MATGSRRKLLSTIIVDDEAPIRRAFERHLRRAGYSVRAAGSVAEGRALLEAGGVDVGFFDYRLPDGTGDELIRWAVANNRVRHAYCMTGYASCRNTVAVMQAGCVDVLEKPFEVDRLTALLARAGAPKPDGAQLQDWRRAYCNDIVGCDDTLVEALGTISSIADTDCTVLVTGESGTGKELAARAVHNASPRRAKPFVALNCAAIPESMVEATLFGHARGAFTGAVASRAGRVASADGGTLFLDEIGDMPLAAQAKLLRMLQEHTITPVGSDDAVSIDVRIVAATNKDLEAMVAEGKFRADLYFRLSVIPIHLPPLRERGEDITILATKFLLDCNERTGRDVIGFEQSALRALREHDWPGNVRELAHLIERCVLLKRSGKLAAKDLRLKKLARGTGKHRRASAEDGLDLRRAIDQVERQLIDEALERTGGNRTEAAALLGLNRTTLVEKIRKHAS